MDFTHAIMKSFHEEGKIDVSVCLDRDKDEGVCPYLMSVQGGWVASYCCGNAGNLHFCRAYRNHDR